VEQALKDAYEKYYEKYGALSGRIATEEGLLEPSSSLPTASFDMTDTFYDHKDV
jgi:hypothetical protein